MPEAIPSILAPYLQECFHDTSLILVTSTLNTPASWLLIRLLHTALSNPRGEHEESTSPISSDARRTVVFVSLLRSSSHWLEVGKKIGIDLAWLSKSGQLNYIDGLASEVQGPNIPSTQSTALKSMRLEDIATAILAQIKAIRLPDGSKHGCAVILDGLDFILASQPDVDIVKVQHFVSSLRSNASNVMLTCSADSPLLHSRHDGATPLEREHSAFVTSMAHQSSLVFQLRGLDTGAAKDVTGVLRISKGGAHDNEESHASLEDGEWLYHLKGDGSVQVWLRGQ